MPKARTVHPPRRKLKRQIFRPVDKNFLLTRLTKYLPVYHCFFEPDLITSWSFCNAAVMCFPMVPVAPIIKIFIFTFFNKVEPKLYLCQVMAHLSSIDIKDTNTHYQYVSRKNNWKKSWAGLRLLNNRLNQYHKRQVETRYYLDVIIGPQAIWWAS